MDLFDNKGSFEYYVKHGQEDIGFDWEADWDGQDAMPVHYSADYGFPEGFLLHALRRLLEDAGTRTQQMT